MNDDLIQLFAIGVICVTIFMIVLTAAAHDDDKTPYTKCLQSCLLANIPDEDELLCIETCGNVHKCSQNEKLDGQ